MDKHYTGVLNVMKYLGMIEGEANVNKKVRILKEPQVLISARKGGLFLAFTKTGQEVKKGQVLARIVNLRGEVVETLTSPIDGIIMCRTNYGTADPNLLPSHPYMFYITQVQKQ